MVQQHGWAVERGGLLVPCFIVDKLKLLNEFKCNQASTTCTAA